MACFPRAPVAPIAAPSRASSPPHSDCHVGSIPTESAKHLELAISYARPAGRHHERTPMPHSPVGKVQSGGGGGVESGAEQRNHKFSPDMVMNTPSVVAIDVPLPAAMDLSKFTPRALARISSIFSNRESESLQEEFGLGSTDWRITATLAIEPGQTATEVSAASVMSKAAR